MDRGILVDGRCATTLPDVMLRETVPRDTMR